MSSNQKGNEDDEPNFEEGFDHTPHIYRKKLTSFKPKFEGKVDGYYENTCLNWIVAILMLLPCYIISIASFWGLISWGLYDTYSYCYTSFAVFIIYIVIIIGVVHIGTLSRKKLEKTYLQKKVEENEWIEGLRRDKIACELQGLKEYEDQRLMRKNSAGSWAF